MTLLDPYFTEEEWEHAVRAQYSSLNSAAGIAREVAALTKVPSLDLRKRAEK